MAGRSPSGRACGPSDLSRDASQPEALVPNADREAEDAFRLGAIYREIRAADYACSELVCTFPHDGNCWCFNRALARHTAQAFGAGLEWAAHCAEHLNGWGCPPAPELADHIAKCIRDHAQGEARRAETLKDGSVHEGAGLKGIAQTQSPSTPDNKDKPNA